MKNKLCLLIFLVVQQFAFGQNTILWKISDTINNKESYIVGTFHQFGSSFVDSIPEIKKVLLNAELAVFESIDHIDSTRKMIDRRKSSLEIEKRLKKKDFIKLKEIAKDWRVDLYKLKPLEISWKLQQEFQKIKCRTTQPTDKFKHFDNYLIYTAKKHKIEIYGLETDSLQLALIDEENKSPNWRKERKNIRYWIKQMTSDKPNLNACRLADKYRKFDIDYEFEKECESDILLAQRNKEWMKILPDMLRKQNIFIAVGYSHLKRKCGILEQLKNMGFAVEQVALKPVANIS
ncbi:TraB/GumN family protein [Sphingobacterium arenae]|uniref:TraB/GumN family protein n=1 Tax=Sphingobacterium arenae TaxID=1280598 RepID=A0ABR7Y5Z4_9SPHI|nr:TraB/GumN family protein [Sphingobacterium arenae]MBD1426716.1 TraB/GumN family protein [Sphingobacterium arenae]